MRRNVSRRLRQPYTTFAFSCRQYCCQSLLLLCLVLPASSLVLYMGLLKVGTPKNWDDSKRNLKYIRKAGLRQFISTYNRVKDLRGDALLWGDEIEYGIFKLDNENKKVRLSLRAKEVMDKLNEREAAQAQMNEGCHWVPEYGAWMVEATPDRPYTGYATDLLRVERNMRLRRQRLLAVLDPDETAPTISTPWRLGAQGDDASVPNVPVGGNRTESEYIGDGIINPHPRFGTLTANIRQRRGSKVNIRVPLFRDTNTPEYANYEPFQGDVDGCCGSDTQQLWRYGKGDASMEKYGRDYLTVGCSRIATDEEFDDSAADEGIILQKWLVDVQCPGCLGLFYRRAPGQIVADADWPRNGDVVVGHELQNVPGWVRLQNGYYLPKHSDDGTIPFLHKVSSRALPTNTELKRIGSNTPLFRSSLADNESVASLLGSEITVETANGGGVAVLTCPTVATSASTAVTANGASTPEEPTKKETVRASIHMDAMAFGMGCCCLQITFQGKDMDESRFMYDQLAVMAPIMMALTAATPILRGRLADTDARWGIISESVDDRTPAERGRADPDAPHEALNASGTRRLYKSRYDSISTFIYQGSPSQYQSNKKGLNNRVMNIYNDIPVPIDEESYHELRAAGIDPALSQHIAHLFTRDPLVVFDGAVEEVDDMTQTEHFESIQSTNWQTVRWKPPPPRVSPNDPHIGWRTEFRSMEIQLTDFENAAFTAFIVLLTRVILTFDLNLYIPLSRVDANMQRAHSRNASAKGKFFFRRHMAPLEEGDDGYGVKYDSMFARAARAEEELLHQDLNGDSSEHANGSNPIVNGISGLSSNSIDIPGDNTAAEDDNDDDDDVSVNRRQAPVAQGSSEENAYEEMTMAEIMTGKGDYFPGLIPLIMAYLDYISVDTVTKKRLSTYLDFIAKRATGELVTPAMWMRNFVRNHPAYKQDSVVSDEIAYDLTCACRDIGLGKLHVPELLGDVTIDPIVVDGAYLAKLTSNRVQNEHILQLLKRYSNRSPFAEKHAVM